MTDIKSLAQFGDDPTSGNRSVNFQFELPRDAPKLLGGTRYLPQSGITSGYACETPSPGYSNSQRTVEGACEISYWVEAEFRLKKQQTGCLTRHVEISDFYPHLHISLQRPIHLSQKLAAGYLSNRTFDKVINVSLVLEQLEPCRNVDDGDTNGIRYVSLPMTLAMNTPSVANSFLPWDTRQSLKCYFEYRWEMKTSFSTNKGQPDAMLDRERLVFKSTSTAVTKRCHVYFRPATNSVVSNHYVAISQLDLAVPDFIKEPSYEWGLLSRQYSIHVSLAFEKLEGQLIPKFQTVLRLMVDAGEIFAEDIGGMSTGKAAVNSQHGGEAAEWMTRCPSPLPLYC